MTRKSVGGVSRPGVMRRAQSVKAPSTKAVSSTFPVKAPIKGWWAQDNIADMPANAAFVLDNWFPETDSVAVRPGYDQFASITGAAAIGTIMVHEAGGTSTLLAATGASIYNFTAGGTIGSSASSGYASSDFSWLNFATSGTNYLVMANGADSVKNFDGTSFTTPAITGATSSTFNYVFSYGDRLFFIKKNSSTCYFLPTDSIAGAVGTLQLGALLTYGGTIIAGASLTIDGGNGPANHCMFLSSEGEVVLYTGTDPADPDFWSLVGVYRIGRPIGHRCLLQIGGDIAVVCADGVASLSRSILLDRAAAQRGAFTGNIRQAFTSRFTSVGTINGWQIISWPAGHMAIVNIPITAGATFEQFAMNVITGAWARFTDINSLCWAQAAQHMYFGTSAGKIMKFGETGYDNGSAINATCVPAFSDMNAPAHIKHIKEAQVFIRTAGTFVVGMNIAVDFNIPTTTSVSNEFDVDAGAEWGSAIWGTDVWPSPAPIAQAWLGIAGSGYYLSPMIVAQATTASAAISFLSANLLYEVGTAI